MVPCYMDEDDMPVFGKIVDIIVLPTSECLFILAPHVCTKFNAHFHAFEVTSVQDVFFYNHKELHWLIWGVCMFRYLVPGKGC